MPDLTGGEVGVIVGGKRKRGDGEVGSVSLNRVHPRTRCGSPLVRVLEGEGLVVDRVKRFGGGGGGGGGVDAEPVAAPVVPSSTLSASFEALPSEASSTTTFHHDVGFAETPASTTSLAFTSFVEASRYLGAPDVNPFPFVTGANGGDATLAPVGSVTPMIVISHQGSGEWERDSTVDYIVGSFMDGMQGMDGFGGQQQQQQQQEEVDQAVTFSSHLEQQQQQQQQQQDVRYSDDMLVLDFSNMPVLDPSSASFAFPPVVGGGASDGNQWTSQGGAPDAGQWTPQGVGATAGSLTPSMSTTLFSQLMNPLVTPQDKQDAGEFQQQQQQQTVPTHGSPLVGQGQMFRPMVSNQVPQQSFGGYSSLAPFHHFGQTQPAPPQHHHHQQQQQQLQYHHHQPHHAFPYPAHHHQQFGLSPGAAASTYRPQTTPTAPTYSFPYPAPPPPPHSQHTPYPLPGSPVHFHRPNPPPLLPRLASPHPPQQKKRPTAAALRNHPPPMGGGVGPSQPLASPHLGNPPASPPSSATPPPPPPPAPSAPLLTVVEEEEEELGCSVLGCGK
ncbi:hypothetical protein HDU67_004131, partial [Dinochytrium kinnereticum]